MNHISDFVQSRPEGVPKTARGRRTLLRLLEAAETEFGAKGYHDASVTRITEGAGVAMGTFYVHFPSKEAVFRALVSYMGQLTRRWIAERVADAPDRIAAERLGIAAFIEFVRTHGNLYRIVNEAQFVAPDAYRHYYTEFAEHYAEHLKAAAANGEIRDGDAESRAWALIGMSVFLGQRFGLWAEDVPADDIAAHVADLIESGLRPAALAEGAAS